jgi:hypothetical protein
MTGVLEGIRVVELGQVLAGADFKLVGMPLSFDGERPAIAAAGAAPGEHNGEFLAGEHEFRSVD